MQYIHKTDSKWATIGYNMFVPTRGDGWDASLGAFEAQAAHA